MNGMKKKHHHLNKCEIRINLITSLILSNKIRRWPVSFKFLVYIYTLIIIINIY